MKRIDGNTVLSSLTICNTYYNRLWYSDIMGAPMKYKFHIEDVVDDMKVVNVVKQPKGTKYFCVCTKCGREKTFEGFRLFNHIGTMHKSCGQGLKQTNLRFYSIWQNMRTRTTNQNSDHFDCYGGRGIKSDQFANFIDFYDLMFDDYIAKTKQYGCLVSLERIDVDGDYTVDNCV